MSMLLQLWRDDRGAVISTELTMVLGIAVSGLGAGMATLRNNVNRHMIAVSELPGVVIPTAAELQAQIAAPPYTAKTLSHSQGNATAYSGSHTNVYVSVQIPSRYDLPSP